MHSKQYWFTRLKPWLKFAFKKQLCWLQVNSIFAIIYKDYSILSELNKSFQQTDWLSDLLYDYTYTVSDGEYFWAWLLSLSFLLSRQVNITDSCWMNVSFIQKTSFQVKNIWKARIFKMTAVALGPKVLSRTRIQGILKESLIANRSRLIEQKLFILRRWWQLWTTTKTIKKLPDGFI